MPFALAIIGIALVVAGVRNRQDDLFKLVKGDFTGQNNFIFWFLAIMMIGAIGYVPRLKPISTSFLALVIIVLFLKKGTGFFSQLEAAAGRTQTNLNPAVVNSVSGNLNPNEPLGNLPLAQLQPLGGIQ